MADDEESEANDSANINMVAATLTAALLPRIEFTAADGKLGPSEIQLRQNQAVINACDLFEQVRARLTIVRLNRQRKRRPAARRAARGKTRRNGKGTAAANDAG